MEVQQLMPDVLSLQEVDRPDDFVYNLSKLGYQYDYVGRTGDKTDGCACFWNAAKLRCRDSKMINFADIGLRDNVAQILMLEDADSEGQRIVIANTHILFNPKRGDIKVAQIRIILEAVHDMRQRYGGTVPCMFMGDLNLTPDSALYSFIATGQLDCLAQDPRNMSGQQESRSSQQFSMRRQSYAPQAASPLPVPSSYQHYSAEQVARPTHTRFGMDASDNMLNISRGLPTASPAASHPHMYAPAAHAAAVPQLQPALQSPQVAADTQPVHAHISMTETKKIKLDRDGLVAVQASRIVTSAVQPECDRVAPPPGLTRGGFDLRTLKPDCDPLGPAGRCVMTGPTLRVEESKAMATPALLNSSGVAAAMPALQYQGTPARAPGWGPSMLPPNSSSPQFPQETPQRMLPHTQRFGSGRGRVGMDLGQLAIAHTMEVYNPTTALEPILRHPLQLQSAYMEVTGVEPTFTSSHLRFHGTVDYIWYTPEVSLSLYLPVRVSHPWTGRCFKP
ncbi:hypothetical protein ABBQ32_003887 [Trebouxia sp. C0010 RCD-2024]